MGEIHAVSYFEVSFEIKWLIKNAIYKTCPHHTWRTTPNEPWNMTLPNCYVLSIYMYVIKKKPPKLYREVKVVIDLLGPSQSLQ